MTMALSRGTLTTDINLDDGRTWKAGLRVAGMHKEDGTFQTLSLLQTMHEDGKFEWSWITIKIPQEKVVVTSSGDNDSPIRILLQTVFLILFGFMQTDLKMMSIRINPDSISGLSDVELVDELVIISRDRGSFLSPELQQLLDEYVDLNNDIPLTPHVMNFFGAYMRSCILALHRGMRIPDNCDTTLEQSRELIESLASIFKEKGIEIRPSPGKGMGVFASRKVDKHCCICIYPVDGIGTCTKKHSGQSSWAEISCPDQESLLAHANGSGRYIIRVPAITAYSMKECQQDSFIFANPENRCGLMHLCNCGGKANSNLDVLYLPGRVVVGITKVDLAADSEITLFYGEGYWEALGEVPNYTE